MNGLKPAYGPSRVDVCGDRDDLPESGGSEALLRKAINRLGFSARAYHRVLKIARTIADLEGAGSIGTPHVAEAIQYRSLDRLMRS